MPALIFVKLEGGPLDGLARWVKAPTREHPEMILMPHRRGRVVTELHGYAHRGGGAYEHKHCVGTKGVPRGD